eukprot:2659971-Pleurochrysis_carterae.AAC.2
MSSTEPPPMIVVSATFYPNLQDIRCVMGIRACESADRVLVQDGPTRETRNERICTAYFSIALNAVFDCTACLLHRLLLVDASPPEVRAALEHAGATVKPQASSAGLPTQVCGTSGGMRTSTARTHVREYARPHKAHRCP